MDARARRLEFPRVRLGLSVLEKIDDSDQTRTMEGFGSFFSGDQLRSATDLRGCQVESIHGSQPVRFSLYAGDFVNSFEIAHPLGIMEESVIESCFRSL